MNTSTYPPSPTSLPKGLTNLSASYNFRATMAVVSILLFFLLYFSLVCSLAYVVYLAVIYDMGDVNKLTLLMKLGAIAGSIMLFLFTLKFILKLKNPSFNNRIKLDKAQHPELIAFIENICKETGAPKPKSIYVDPDVNAYVAYSNMWLSLILPVKKDLTIGMGLVSCLNLSEFKAVTTHEFGHFSQSSMKIGSYIISANTIIHDMIFTRDKWDEILVQWRSADIRLSAAAWVITPVIWLIRQLLNLFYTFLNIMYSSLSREMEFNADKVAVSTTGSEAIVSGLWKLDSGAQKWNLTVNNAYLAAQKQMYSKNLYKHYLLSLDRSASQIQEALHKLPLDNTGTKNYFSSSEMSKVSMYASHPPNDQREKNAKNPFVPCKEDERSPWILFAKQDKLQEEMTALIYEQYLNKQPRTFASTEQFEEFILAESHGNDLMEEYQNTFVNRFLHIPDETELNNVQVPETGNMHDKINALKNQLTELMKPVLEIEQLMSKAQEIANGTTKEKSFTFNNVVYEKKHLQTGYGELISQREKLFNEQFKEWDTAFCALNMALAKSKGKEKELKNLYAQHAALTKLYKAVVATKNAIFTELNGLQGRDDVTKAEVNTFAEKITSYIKDLNVELDEFDKLDFYQLPNIESIQEFKEAVIEGGKFPEISGPLFENGGFAIISGALENAVLHCQRLDQKNITAILSYQNNIINKQ